MQSNFSETYNFVDHSNTDVRNNQDLMESQKITEHDSTWIDNSDASTKLSLLLNKPSILHIVSKFPIDIRDNIVGAIIEFGILFPDNDEQCNRFLYDLLWDLWTIFDPFPKKTAFLIKYATQYLWVNNSLDTLEDQEKVFSLFRILNGYYFHGFNGVFEKSIREKWIDVDTRFWDWEELERIQEICAGAGHRRVLWWGDLNCKGKISVGANSSNVYRYGFASPEWFAQFVSEGWHIPWIPPYDKTAFYRRDYLAAKQNILSFCQKMRSSKEDDIIARKAYPNITLEEQLEILTFFEKYWKVFATNHSTPKLALIKKSTVWEDYSPSSFIEYYRKDEEFNSNQKITSLKADLEEAIEYLMSWRCVDHQLSVSIPPEEIQIINLPPYKKIFW